MVLIIRGVIPVMLGAAYASVPEDKEDVCPATPTATLRPVPTPGALVHVISEKVTVIEQEVAL
jgi:hypothetical protein